MQDRDGLGCQEPNRVTCVKLLLQHERRTNRRTSVGLPIVPDVYSSAPRQSRRQPTTAPGNGRPPTRREILQPEDPVVVPQLVFAYRNPVLQVRKLDDDVLETMITVRSACSRALRRNTCASVRRFAIGLRYGTR